MDIFIFEMYKDNYTQSVSRRSYLFQLRHVNSDAYVCCDFLDYKLNRFCFLWKLLEIKYRLFSVFFYQKRDVNVNITEGKHRDISKVISRMVEARKCIIAILNLKRKDKWLRLEIWFRITFSGIPYIVVTQKKKKNRKFKLFLNRSWNVKNYAL